MKTILHLCADIGSDSKPYRDAGYNVICVGEKYKNDKWFTVGALDGVEGFHPPKEVYGVIANPVCTEFSIAKGFHKAGDYRKGMSLVLECQRIIHECNPHFWAIENPASGRLKDFLGCPTFTYEPWEFGSPWTKKTALWGKFNLPMKKYQNWSEVPKNPNLYVRPTRGKPSMAFLHKSAKKHIREFDCFDVADDMSFRSLCSQNFAQAFFEANQ